VQSKKSPRFFAEKGGEKKKRGGNKQPLIRKRSCTYGGEERGSKKRRGEKSREMHVERGQAFLLEGRKKGGGNRAGQ